MTPYEQGQSDLIDQIKKEVLKIEQNSSPDMLIVDILSLLKSLNPIKK
jgi:hypothetical protein